MPAGITTQYGFLFQRYIFIKTVLDFIGIDTFFVYEGADDIDVINEERIVSIGISNNTYIQVKSGNSFDEIYPSLIKMAQSIGIQTIFISKHLPTYIKQEDLTDISGGLNPFHLRRGD